MDKQVEKLILEKAATRLAELEEAAKTAEAEKAARDEEIKKCLAIIDLFGQQELGLSHGSADKNTSGIVIDKVVEKTSVGSEVTFDYPENTTWIEKIKAYFKFRNVALTVEQIVDEFYPHHEGDKPKFKALISNMVLSMVKKGLLQVYKPEIKMRAYYYANPSWFEGGALREEHKPDLNERLAW